MRQSTELPARDDTWEDADAIRLRIEAEIRREVVHGVRPSLPLGIAAHRWLTLRRDRPLRAREIATIQEASARFGTRLMASIGDAEWNRLVDDRCDGRAPATRRRWLNPLFPFLRWCAAPARGWIAKLPEIDRPKVDRRRQHAARRRVVDLRPDLVDLMIDHAAPHFAAQLWVMRSTGARVSSILFACRLCDLVLGEARSQITFHETKNGDPVTAALTPRAAEGLRRYLARRGRLDWREGPLFLDHRGMPYSAKLRGQAGGQIKGAMKGMKRRTVRTLLRGAVRARRAGDLEAWRRGRADARLVAQVTPHWFRHALASTMFALGADPRTVMDQGGWRDIESVMVYAHAVPAARRRIVDQLDGDTPLTRADPPTAKPAGRSRA